MLANLVQVYFIVHMILKVFCSSNRTSFKTLKFWKQVACILKVWYAILFILLLSSFEGFFSLNVFNIFKMIFEQSWNSDKAFCLILFSKFPWTLEMYGQAACADAHPLRIGQLWHRFLRLDTYFGTEVPKYRNLFVETSLSKEFRTFRLILF